MIHEAYMPVYMGSRFLARDGRTEVVQEALADLKTACRRPRFGGGGIWIQPKIMRVFMDSPQL